MESAWVPILQCSGGEFHIGQTELTRRAEEVFAKMESTLNLLEQFKTISSDTSHRFTTDCHLNH